MRKHTRVIWPRSYEYIIQYPPRWERVKGGFIGIHTTIAVIVGILAEHRWKHLVQIGQLLPSLYKLPTFAWYMKISTRTKRTREMYRSALRYKL